MDRDALVRWLNETSAALDAIDGDIAARLGEWPALRDALRQTGEAMEALQADADAARDRWLAAYRSEAAAAQQLVSNATACARAILGAGRAAAEETLAAARAEAERAREDAKTSAVATLRDAQERAESAVASAERLAEQKLAEVRHEADFILDGARRQAGEAAEAVATAQRQAVDIADEAQRGAQAVLEDARRQATALVATARHEAAAELETARRQADEDVAAAKEQAVETAAEAQRGADAVLEDARRQATALVATARHEAAAELETARRQADEDVAAAKEQAAEALAEAQLALAEARRQADVVTGQAEEYVGGLITRLERLLPEQDELARAFERLMHEYSAAVEAVGRAQADARDQAIPKLRRLLAALKAGGRMEDDEPSLQDGRAQSHDAPEDVATQAGSIDHATDMTGTVAVEGASDETTARFVVALSQLPNVERAVLATQWHVPRLAMIDVTVTAGSLADLNFSALQHFTTRVTNTTPAMVVVRVEETADGQAETRVPAPDPDGEEQGGDVHRESEWLVVPKVHKHLFPGLWMWELVTYPAAAGPQASRRLCGGIENSEEDAMEAARRAAEQAAAKAGEPHP